MKKKRKDTQGSRGSEGIRNTSLKWLAPVGLSNRALLRRNISKFFVKKYKAFATAVFVPHPAAKVHQLFRHRSGVTVNSFTGTVKLPAP